MAVVIKNLNGKQNNSSPEAKALGDKALDVSDEEKKAREEKAKMRDEIGEFLVPFNQKRFYIRL